MAAGWAGEIRKSEMRKMVANFRHQAFFRVSPGQNPPIPAIRLPNPLSPA